MNELCRTVNVRPRLLAILKPPRPLPSWKPVQLLTSGFKLQSVQLQMQVILIWRCVVVQYVTRAVRVVDLITNLDMQAFQQYGGMTAFINRLQVSCWHQFCSANLCDNDIVLINKKIYEENDKGWWWLYMMAVFTLEIWLKPNLF